MYCIAPGLVIEGLNKFLPCTHEIIRPLFQQQNPATIAPSKLMPSSAVLLNSFLVSILICSIQCIVLI